MSDMYRRRFLATVAATIPPIAGCLQFAGGGSDGGGQAETPPVAETSTPSKASVPTPTSTPMATPTDTPSPTPTAPPTETPTATPAGSVGQRKYPHYNWGKLEDASPEFTTEIRLKNTAFHPPIAEVPRGTPVRFVNEDSFGHTVTIPARDINTQLSGGASTTVTFDALDTFDYVCTLHPPFMLGRLIVTEQTPTPTPKETPTPTPDGGDGGSY